MKKEDYPVTAFRICVDFGSSQGGDIKGRLYGVALEEENKFEGGADLLLLIDRLLDKIGKPQATRKSRSFKPQKESLESGYHNDSKRYHTTQEVAEKTGTLLTRDLYVITRSSSTWQGFVKNEENEMLGSFESDLEFLKIMLHDHRVTTTMDNKD